MVVVMVMNKIKPSLNILKPDRASILKWLSPDELARLERMVLDITPAQYRFLKYSWGMGDGKK